MLICPLCQQPLHDSQTGKVCVNNHTFDRARQGYLHLLPVQHKASRAPGDNALMVQARRNFLSAGHYAELAGFLARQAAELTPNNWLDIGCGEGYYSNTLATQMPAAQGYALDISKDAIRQACKRNKSITWLIASMMRIPLANQSCDLITSVFSPIDWNEAARLLTSKGHLLHLGPATGHLLELRQAIYDKVRPYDDSKHLHTLPKHLRCVETRYLSYPLTLSDAEHRQALLDMTPHGWRARTERKQAILAQPLTVTVAVRLDIIQPQQETAHAN